MRKFGFLVLALFSMALMACDLFGPKFSSVTVSYTNGGTSRSVSTDSLDSNIFIEGMFFTALREGYDVDPTTADVMISNPKPVGPSIVYEGLEVGKIYTLYVIPAFVYPSGQIVAFSHIESFATDYGVRKIIFEAKETNIIEFRFGPSPFNSNSDVFYTTVNEITEFSHFGISRLSVANPYYNAQAIWETYNRIESEVNADFFGTDNIGIFRYGNPYRGAEPPPASASHPL